MSVTLWLLILDCQAAGCKEECFLMLGNSTSALGWLYQVSRFQDSSFYHRAVHLIAWKIACLMSESSHSLASQHIHGP